MSGLLLDTHALFWLVSDAALLNEDALVAIAESQDAENLLVSAITSWELAVATMKTRVADRPGLSIITGHTIIAPILSRGGSGSEDRQLTGKYREAVDLVDDRARNRSRRLPVVK